MSCRRDPPSALYANADLSVECRDRRRRTVTPLAVGVGVPFAIASAAIRVMLNDPTRLMLTARAKLTSACRPSLPTTFALTMPAQLTRPCSRHSRQRRRHGLRARPVDDVSARNRARSPSSAASALPAASLRSLITTLPPPATTMRAVAAPSPDAPPVTRNVLPSSCIAPASVCLRSRSSDAPGSISAAP